MLFIGVIYAFLVFFFDTMIPLGVAGGVLYVGLPFVGLIYREKKIIVFAGIIGTLLTILGLVFSPFGSEFWMVWSNRFLTIAMLWGTVLLCVFFLQYEEEKMRSREVVGANKLLQKEIDYMQLNKDIAVFANFSQSVEDAISTSLERICDEMKWPIGHFLFYDKETKLLATSKLWYLKDKEKYQVFQNKTEETQFKIKVGLPGRVLENKKPFWIKDVVTDPNFPRSGEASKIGIHSGLAFPVFIGEKVVGVMEFYSEDFLEPNLRFLEVIENIGILLGRVIERERANKKKEEYQEHLRRLYSKLDSIREDESKRLSREVHDELGQLLTILKLELSLLENNLEYEDHPIRQNIDVMFELIGKAIKAVKRISQNLRPPILDSVSLNEVIEWQGGLFKKKTGIEFDFKAFSNNINLTPDKSTSIYRIFQECLTNITRHSKAKLVNVQLQNDNNKMIMKIIDNGIGFDQKRNENEVSLGILGMKERAQLIGGDLYIEGKKGEGTTVTLILNHGNDNGKTN